MTAKTLMITGSMSSVGKSLLVAALCRIFMRKGIRVAPFKAQNMSNNAAVCPDGGEIGRATAFQAYAAGILPKVDMNPVLIKPEADSHSQIILLGKPWMSLPARKYYEKKAELWRYVTASLDHLRSQYDLLLIEGAGSAAELNLKRNDIVNMAIAVYAQSPVLLAGDIDRGGIFAQLVGTLLLMDPIERALIRGMIVNKFRGDLALFQEGVRILEEKGNTRVVGVIPYLRDLNLPDEDAVSIERGTLGEPGLNQGELDIAVIAFPRIANFDDFDPLAAEEGVRLRYVRTLHKLGNPDAIILPGTKSTIADLNWMEQEGIAQAVVKFAENGKTIVGICGGYQMLGKKIEDLHRLESQETSCSGLNLLPVTTHFLSDKATYQADATIIGGQGWIKSLQGMHLRGYEIHMGKTTGTVNPWMEICRRNQQQNVVADGYCSADGKIWGSYLHGIFDNDAFRHAWLKSFGWQNQSGINQCESMSQSLEKLADSVEKALDMTYLNQIIWEENPGF